MAEQLDKTNRDEKKYKPSIYEFQMNRVQGTAVVKICRSRSRSRSRKEGKEGKLEEWRNSSLGPAQSHLPGPDGQTARPANRTCLSIGGSA